MDIPVNIKIPDYVYHFYQNAAKSISCKTTEQIMEDALSAYAALLCDDVMKTRNRTIEKATQKAKTAISD